MSNREVEIRGTTWKLCSDGVWRTDREFWGTPITDAINEVISLRARVAELEADCKEWQRDSKRQAELAEFWRAQAEKHMTPGAFTRAWSVSLALMNRQEQP